MALDIHVLAQSGPLPAVAWQWDPETGILSGGIRIDSPGAGYTGTVELNDDEGSIVLLDLQGGVLCGLDIVMWPEVTTVPGLAAPAEAPAGRIVVPSRSAQRGVTALEFDTTLSLAADATADTFHLRIGTRRAVEPVRLADRFVAEIDAANRLAGFWLEGVPAPPPPTDLE